MLNFRYLFILFLALSLNSYSLLEVGINCRFDNDGWCIFGQDVMTTSGNEAVWEVFDTGFDNTLESINENFNIVVSTSSNDFPNWEVSGLALAAGTGNTDFTSFFWSPSGLDGVYRSQESAWATAQDSDVRDYNTSIMEGYALVAKNSAVAYSNNLLDNGVRIDAAAAKDNALAKKNLASVYASLANTRALAAENIDDDIIDDYVEVYQAKGQATTDINNKITDIVNSLDDVGTQALTNIEQYVSDVLNTPVNVVDYELVMTTALGTGTGSLNALASNISNAGNSQDNTALVNSLNSLSSSISNLGAVDDTGTLNAIGSLKGVLGVNTGALGGLSNVITDGDGSGEIGNKSGTLFNALKNSFTTPSFVSSGVSCPMWAFDEGALLVGGLVIDSHCEVIDMIRPSFELAMLSFFSVMGFRVVFSA